MVGLVKELVEGRALVGVVAKADLTSFVLNGDGWERWEWWAGEEGVGSLCSTHQGAVGRSKV